MYFPWVGLLEQVRLADCFVHYDDVQFARGFYNRVQVKTVNGIRWLTVPLRDRHRGQTIEQVQVDDQANWRQRHHDILRQAYLKAPFRDDMLALVEAVFASAGPTLGQVARQSVRALAEYFGLSKEKTFENSREIGVPGSGSKRLLEIVLRLNGDTYITGHGARNYLDHELFERAGVSVKYMNYQCAEYPQMHGPFTPYLTALDLVANCGKSGASFIRSEAVDWKEFIDA